MNRRGQSKTRILTTIDALNHRIEDRFLSSNDIFILGICGFAGAGKSTLCRTIAEIAKVSTRHFECDRFSAFSHSERQRRIAQATANNDMAALATEENPLNWYAWDNIGQALEDLRRRRNFFYTRGWNSGTGLLDETYAITLPETGPALVLCDCIYLLHPPVRHWFDATLLVDTAFGLTVERGRARSGNKAASDYLERLNQTYASPYFEAYSALADWVYRTGPAPTNTTDP